MPIYNPHSALVYTVSGDTYTATSVALTGHLTKREFTSTLTETGWNAQESGVYIFRWEDRGKVKQGDRLYIDTNFWNVVSPVMSRDEVYILRESRVLVEKTVE